MKKISYTPIGIIHTPFKEPRGVPIQPTAGQDIQAVVEVFPEFSEGLADLEGFSHLILLFHMHLSREYSLKVTPFMDTRLRGLFSTRAPSRPNSIGLSIVRLEKVEDNRLYIRDVDMVDKSPLLDIKPYFSTLDEREEVRIGWLENKIDNLHKTRDDGRFKQ